MTTLKPVFARVILRREKLKSKVGSIIIPDVAGAKHAYDHGEIIAVGPTADPSFLPGMLVVFGKYAGSWVKIPGADDELYICNDEDILAIVEN